MTPESLDWWADKLAVVTAILTLAAATAGVFAYFFASWSSQAKDDALSRYKADAAVAISQANADAAQAKVDAANANTQTAHANERAALAQNDAAHAQLATEQFKAQLAWRTISISSGEAMVNSLLKSPGSIHLTYVAGDPESLFLAIQLQKIFIAGKWNVNTMGKQYMTNIVWGIFIPDDPPNATLVANARAAFDAGEIPFNTTTPMNSGSGMAVGNFKQANEIEITIGSKQPPL